MEKLKKEFEALLKTVHAMRPIVELELQKSREEGYDLGYTNGKRAGIDFERSRNHG